MREKIDLHAIISVAVSMLGLVHLLHLFSSEQLADELAKGLAHVHRSYLKNKLGVKNLFITPSLREC
uniref:Putative ovule protein n=1 Tax=Solanum chacoense TaxID=4108 RepID=A0A0V0HLR1_SOLCH